MFITRPRCNTASSVELSSKFRSIRCVHLKKEFSSDDLRKRNLKLDLAQINNTKIPHIQIPNIKDDKVKEKAIMSDLCAFKYESVEQILKKKKDTLTNHSTKNLFEMKEYYRCYKNFNRSKQENKLMQVPSNMFMSMIDVAQSQNLIPRPLGIPRLKDPRLSIDISGQLLGQQQYTKVVAGVLKIQPNPEMLNLAGNKLTPEAIQDILGELKEGIKVIDLSNNKIGNNLNFPLQFTSLQKLILAGTELKDKSLKILSQGFPKFLKALDLSNNLLTDACIQNLPIDSEISELYLKWNRISGLGGNKLFKLLLKNATLRVLDLSYNSLGHPQKLCLNQIRDMLASTSSEIIHLDLSHNQFCQADCEFIADCLERNQQMIGFHFIGNQEWYIDPDGWARDKRSPQVTVNSNLIKKFKGNQIDMDQINEQIRQILAIQNLEDQLNIINPRHVKVRSKISSFDFQGENKLQNKGYDLFDCCWICDGWIEMQFEWIPSLSGQIDQEPIYLHLEFLQYKPLLMEFYNKTFYLYIMCPSNKTIRYFFSNPNLGVQLNAKNQEISELQESDILRKKEKFRPVFNYAVDVHFRSNQMTSTNIIKTKRVKLFNKYSQFIFNSRPRRNVRDYNRFNFYEKSTVWTLQNSIFKNYLGDSDTFLDQCFEFDFKKSRIPKICEYEHQEQTELVKEVLRPYYKQIITAYKYYASISMNLNVPCVQPTIFSEMLSNTNVMKGQIHSNDIQVFFISASSKDLDNHKIELEYLVERCVVRHQFMELLVRVAVDKYAKQGFEKPECIKKLFQDDKLLEWFTKFDLQQQWRMERYFNKECDQVLTKCMPAIQQIYLYATSLSLKQHAHRIKLIHYHDFHQIINEAGLLLADLREREVMNIFIISIQTQINELVNLEHFMMSIFEFMEALGRLAEYLSPCNEDDLSVHQRRTTPLHHKLYVLIWILYHQLKPSIQTFYSHKDVPFKDYEPLFDILLRPHDQSSPFNPVYGQEETEYDGGRSTTRSQSQIGSPKKASNTLDKIKLSRVQSMEQIDTELELLKSMRRPTFMMSSLLGITENKSPVPRRSLVGIYKQLKQSQQYQVMKCLNYF